MTLGEHLGAEQNAGLALVDVVHQGLHGALALHGVAVDAMDRPLLEARVQEILGLFGAQSRGQQSLAVTLGTLPGQRAGVTAVMAAQAPRGGGEWSDVHRRRDIRRPSRNRDTAGWGRNRGG